MATAKREIYGRLAVQLRDHERPVIAEAACPGAMGLYAFLVIQARGEQTRGDTLATIAYASWGAPIAYRKRQAAALIKAGLVEEREGRLVVVKYLEHNDGPEEIAEAKARQNTRQDKRRHPEKYANDVTVTRDIPVTSRACPPDFPISSSISGSDLESRSGDPPRSPREPECDIGPRLEFSPGTAGAEEARAAFESGVQASTGGPFALARAPFHARDLCAAMNTHVPPEITSKVDALRWLPTVIAVWIRVAAPTTITPGKLLDWLNAGRPEPSSSRRGPPRQPQAGPDPKWLADAKAGRTGTGDF